MSTDRWQKYYKDKVSTDKPWAKIMKIQEANKETIWHFTCEECHGWWSIAVMDAWRPYKLYCPHCGDKNDHSTD